MSETVNIAASLPKMAARLPHSPAIYCPGRRGSDGRIRYSQYTYRELDDQSDLIARGLTAVGVGRGVRVALMVKPSLEFFALTFGLFKAGAVPVMIDPGMGLRSLKTCLGEAAPRAFIGIPAAHAARLVLGWARGSLKTLITVGRRWAWGGLSLDQVRAAGAGAGAGPFLAHTQPEDPAAILFTSGSTGAPKGVLYEHRHFVNQVAMIRDAYDIRPGEIDLPTFPLFALFDPALGMTTVVPDMDFTRPAAVDAGLLTEAVLRFGVTNMFGSPALLKTLGRYGAAQGTRLPSLKRVISAGAPVPGPVMRRVLDMLPPGAVIHTPYGATECLPVATLDSGALLGETWARTQEGAGVCVGHPVPPNVVRIIRVTDDPIDDWHEALCLPDGQIGEVVVRGPTVTASYFNRAASTRLAKIRDGEGHRHRMGDLGYLDPRGRLWFCGRKSHRVQTAAGTLYTVPCEAVFNTHPAVARAALVGLGVPGARRPVICVELEPSASASWESITHDLRALAQRYEHTRGLAEFLRHPGFPVDIRHNAKIRREALARWAARRLR